jgi:hypothetical protein
MEPVKKLLWIISMNRLFLIPDLLSLVIDYEFEMDAFNNFHNVSNENVINLDRFILLDQKHNLLHWDL